MRACVWCVCVLCVCVCVCVLYVSVCCFAFSCLLFLRWVGGGVMCNFIYLFIYLLNPIIYVKVIYIIR